MEEFNKIKPLDDGDIARIMSHIVRGGDEAINNSNKIFTEFRNMITELIRLIESNIEDDDLEEIAELDRLKRLISLAPEEQIFLRCKDKIWLTREQLLNKDLEWFIGKECSHLIKNDKNKEFIETLMRIVKRKFLELDEEEKDEYWKYIHKLLNIVARFQKIIVNIN